MLVLDKLNVVERPVKSNTTLGIYSRYDGNLAGGALVGIGMALSGACPGTVLVQLAQGIPSANLTAARHDSSKRNDIGGLEHPGAGSVFAVRRSDRAVAAFHTDGSYKYTGCSDTWWSSHKLCTSRLTAPDFQSTRRINRV
jgi:hypothetical protein